MPGIGGAFLSSRDPERLVEWFSNVLGIEMEAQGEGGMAVMKAGDSVAILAVHAAREGSPSPAPGEVEAEPYGRQPLMLNIRVDDIDATLARLKQHGHASAGPSHYEGIGRFAWTRTPDGHDIELWQP